MTLGGLVVVIVVVVIVVVLLISFLVNLCLDEIVWQ